MGLYDIVAAFWHADLPLDEPITVIPEIPIWVSLLFIAGTIAVATVASLAKTRKDRRASAIAEKADDADAAADAISEARSDARDRS